MFLSFAIVCWVGSAGLDCELFYKETVFTTSEACQAEAAASHEMFLENFPFVRTGCVPVPGEEV
jgi:hypothetical protein